MADSPFGDPTQATIGVVPEPTPNGPSDWLQYYNNIMGSGLYSGSNPSSNVWSSYLQNLPWTTWYMGLESDPKQGFGVYNQLVGQNNNSYQNWLGGQYSKYWDQYNTLSSQNPGLLWTDYLKTINPSQDYSMTDPYNRNGYFHQAGQYAPIQRMIQ